MEIKEKEKVEVATTEKPATKEITIFDKPLYIGAEEYDPKEVCKFAIRQAGLKEYTKTELMYIVNTCKEKGLNPMKGEISFFKARNGMLQAIPKYTTQLELLWREFKKDDNFITFNVFIERDKDTQEWRATAKAEYLDQSKGKYTREITLYSGDWKNTNGMVRFMLQKQSTLQFIRLYYPHIDLGYDIDELQTFNSGLNEKTKPQDHRVVDVEVQPKTLDKLAKEVK